MSSPIRLLHLDSSARPGTSETSRHGSHTRRLSARFVRRWLEHAPDAQVVYRDIGAEPPSPVDGPWVHAAFTPPAQREPWMHDRLAQSDGLIDELLAADVIVAGVPMYNFGMPAQFKAYIDNIVRVGRTFGFDRSRTGEPYWPLLAGMNKRLVILSSRGDFGYCPGQRIAHMNHVEGGVATAFGYIGISDVASVAIEYDEFADDRLRASIASAENEVDALVARMAGAAVEAA
ncbi:MULTISPECIES: FMN-dependent NADH-azoreductase [Ralstonia]|uniref:FMN dependent NADH:quinone oxidoreductase n=1 Tax=Ralstonia holmesii TaxID=3058602 RepID=A0ABC8Q999_9RALS|nr:MULTISPECIES: NAD(P)H-dependent oxidoreductase [unclassified Ralstonia]CAJ0784416.1 FMN-dependent NADH-azoreductase 1 [Ralstonia sp. LMG 32967]CAJ0815236.1 FMN-dependent NADH-azoreductase 1 [Ralstonia sp. LMG 32967]